MKRYRITASYMDKRNNSYTSVLEQEISDTESIEDYIPPKMPKIVETWNLENHLGGIEYVHSKAFYEEEARKTGKNLSALLEEVGNVYLTITTRPLK